MAIFHEQGVTNYNLFKLFVLRVILMCHILVTPCAKEITCITVYFKTFTHFFWSRLRLSHVFFFFNEMCLFNLLSAELIWNIHLIECEISFCEWRAKMEIISTQCLSVENKKSRTLFFTWRENILIFRWKR